MFCLFCRGQGPFSTVEHVIPESLGNDDLLLEGHVCDGCQNYFGREVEQYVLSKSPIAFWRVMLGTTTKKGKRPTADLSQPREQKGVLPCTSLHHDDFAIAATRGETTELTVIGEGLADKIVSGERSDLRLVFTPHMLYMMGRFLCKVGLELICTVDPAMARSTRYDRARAFARYGPWKPLWPILWHQAGSLDRLQSFRREEGNWYLDSECYTYWLGEVGEHTAFEFGVGTDRYTAVLDEPFSRLLMDAKRHEPSCKLLWYSPTQCALEP